MAGQQARTIKALSDEDIAALRKGERMGMAKAVELNGYPGPVHVLTLAAQLGLTENQQREVTAIFDRMSAAAKPLGAELIAREQTLDQLFAKAEITPERLGTETAAIGELQGACGQCIWPRIWKPAPCRTPIGSPAMNSSAATANGRHRRSIITADKRTG